MTKRVILVALVTIALIFAAIWFSVPRYTEANLKAQLKEIGFTITDIERTSNSPNQATFENIQLDQDGFSTIKRLSVFPGRQGAQKVTIEDAHLTGEIGANWYPVIDGWSLRPLAFPISLEYATLSRALIDVMSNDTGLRFEATGRMEPLSQNQRRIEGSLKSNQHQLTMNSDWIIHWESSGLWTMEGDIHELRLRLPDFQATRMNGWLALSFGHDTGSIMPVIDGQAAAGLLDFGNMRLRNVSLTFSGPVDRWHIILEGLSADHQDVQISADLLQTPKGIDADISIIARDIDSLFDFLTRAHQSLNHRKSMAGAMMSLLVTEGNLRRIRQNVAQRPYDQIEIEIKGPLYDLVGKVITTQVEDDMPHRHIISLNPAER